MAQYFPDNDFTRAITQFVPSPQLEDLVSIASKAMRFKIIADRYTRGFEKADVKGPRGAFKNSGKAIFATEKQERHKKIDQGRIGRYQDTGRTSEEYESQAVGNPSNIRKEFSDTISLVDLDFKDEHTSTRGYNRITLPFVPGDLSYDGSSKFVGIATMGRNTPFYHFTGSEDTVQFNIDWFAKDLDRKDVINSCRWVEALSKSNGYTEPPHRVKLVWGEDDLLFQGDIWLVVEANYVLTDFVQGYRDRFVNGYSDKGTNEMIRVGMLPQQATQKITLKRISDSNRKSSEVIGKLAKNNNYGN
jgi:hypothetical protein